MTTTSNEKLPELQKATGSVSEKIDGELPNREDWEIEFSEKFWECDSIVFANERKRDAVKDFIRNLLQSHNNALVAEIENEKEDEDYLPSEGDHPYSMEFMRERNKIRDTIIRIIQEK